MPGSSLRSDDVVNGLSESISLIKRHVALMAALDTNIAEAEKMNSAAERILAGHVVEEAGVSEVQQLVERQNSMAEERESILAEVDRIGMEMNAKGRFMRLLLQEPLSGRPVAARRPMRAGDKRSGVRDAELDKHWAATVTATNAMSTAQMIAAFRRWLDTVEEDERIAAGSRRIDLLSAWSTLSFEDNEMWIYAEMEPAIRAGEMMLAALEKEASLKVQTVEKSLRTQYALIVAEMRRKGVARHIEKRAPLTRLVEAMWKAHVEPSERAAGALKRNILAQLPLCYPHVADWPEGELSMFLELAAAEPVKNTRRPALEAALSRRKGDVKPDDSKLKWEQMMGFAEALGVTQRNGRPYSNVDSFGKLFSSEWRRLREQGQAALSRRRGST
jgi:hypothetical protein